MSTCHTLFKSYDAKITLSASKIKSLRKSRKSVRDRIRRYFKAEKPNEIAPKFESQGSIVHKTSVEPIPYTATIQGKEYENFTEYDIDDGIYFLGDVDKDRKSPGTYHSWIMAAVDGHTSTFDPEDKTTCVRVRYHNGRHIDLPIYFREEEKTPELAHKSKNYIPSDPLAFTDWIKEQTDGKPQLVSIIRFLKGWRGYREHTRKDKSLPSGLILSILACRNYVGDEDYEKAFSKTVSAINGALGEAYECYRPTTPNDEDLLESFTHKDYFLDQLQKLDDDGKKAVSESSQKKASELWRKHFGNRFPEGEDEQERQSNNDSLTRASSGALYKPYFHDH